MLHGVGKIVISLGEYTPRTEQYLEIMGIGDYYYPNFELESYLALPEEEQGQRIVEIIEEVLSDLARRFGANESVIHEVSAKSRASGFELSVVLPISKFHPSRKYKAEVIATYRRHDPYIKLQLVAREGQVIKTQDLIFSYSIYHTYRKSRWHGNIFTIYATGGKATLQVDFSNELKTC